MGSSDRNARFTASKDALQSTYYVLIGIAFAESLNRVFVKNSQFVGLHVLERPNLPSLLLLFAFLPTLTRLVHGASIHRDAVQTHRFKVLIDFCGFFLQTSMFYIMALSIERVHPFTTVFAILLALDAAWLLFWRRMSYITIGATEKQWILSDALVSLVLTAFPTFFGPLTCALLVFCISSVATGLDYWMNRDFYVPNESSVPSGAV